MSDEMKREQSTDIEHRDEQRELSQEQMEGLKAEGLPDRENMSLVDANVAVPVNAAVAANVLSDHSVAGAGATQTTPVHQTNVG